MAALNTNKSRRKPLTYGKATRKCVIDYEQSRKSSHSQAQFTELVLDGGRTTRLGWAPWEITPDEDTKYGEAEDLDTRTQLIYHATSLRNRVKCPSMTPVPPKAVVVTEAGTTYPSAVRQLTPSEGPEDLDIFEFPSETSGNFKRPRSETITSRKRRRVTVGADGPGASTSNVNSFQSRNPIEESLDQHHVCQARKAEMITSEKLNPRNNIKKTTRKSRTHHNRVHGTNPSQSPRHLASVTYVSNGDVPSEQQALSKDDSLAHEAQLHGDILELGKQDVVPVHLRPFESKVVNCESTIQARLTRKLSKMSTAFQRVQTTKNDPGQNTVNDSPHAYARTCTARRTTLFTRTGHGHMPGRLPGADKDAASESEQDMSYDEVIVGVRTKDDLGERRLQEDMEHAPPVRQGSRKLVHAMKQHQTSGSRQSTSFQWNIQHQSQENGGLDTESPSQAGLTTLEVTALSSTQSIDQEYSQGMIPVQSQAAASSQESGPKITYARQRSYLTEDALGGNEDFNMPIDIELDCTKGRRRRGERSVRPVKSPPLVSQDDESGVGGSSGGGIRSIHELREAGEKHKFLHGIESLLEDLESKESCSLSHKRSTLLSLATKLAVPECALRFTECGLEQRLFDLGRSENDSIGGFLLASAIMFLFCNRSSKLPVSQLQYASAKDFLVALLNTDDDVSTLAWDRRNNMSRVARSELLAFRTLEEHAPVWKYKPPVKVSSRLVALTVLETIVHKLREAGDRTELLSGNTLEQLVEISQLQRDESSSSEKLECGDVTGRLALSILDACTMASRSETDGTLWSREFVAKVVDLLPPTSGSFGGDAAESRNLILRLYLNVTNNDPSLCETFSKSNVITTIFDIIDSHFQALSQGTAREDRKLLLDNLILSLGSLINLVECSDAARVAVLTARSDGGSMLERLLQVFLDRVELAPKASATPPSPAPERFN